MHIALVLAAEPVRLASDQCWRLGMVMSELITNAARHAFAGRPGRVDVTLSKWNDSRCALLRIPGQLPRMPGRGAAPGLSRN